MRGNVRSRRAARLRLADPEGSEADPQLSAELLGITPLDAESIAEDAKSFMPAARPEPAPVSPSPGWSALLPDITLACEYQTQSVLKDVSGQVLASLPETVVAAVTATWPLPEAGKLVVHKALKLAQADAREEATVPKPEPEPRPEDGEPSVRELQRAAEEAMLLHPDDLKALRSRVHASAWLPELSAEYQRNVGNIDMLGVSSGEGVDTSALEDVSRYGLRATWKLSELVFSPHEIKLASTALDLQLARRDVLLEVAKLYFERRRLQLKLRREADPTTRREARARHRRARRAAGCLDRRPALAAPAQAEDAMRCAGLWLLALAACPPPTASLDVAAPNVAQRRARTPGPPASRSAPCPASASTSP